MKCKALITGVVALTLLGSAASLVQSNNSQIVLASKKKKKIKYNTASKIEKALNKGENLQGKTVRFKVTKFVPNSAFGYNLETGKHLNFVSPNYPKAKKGQTVTVKIKKVTSVLGSYVITYSHLRKK
uniref:hypothetical protein n=1 Tax=Lactobacillus acidophilus TaxID=1579 RepID=UPI003F55A177